MGFWDRVARNEGTRRTLKSVKRHSTLKRSTLSGASRQTLGSGNMVDAVLLPEGENLNEWLAANVVDFFNEVSLLYGLCAEDASRFHHADDGGFPPGFEYHWKNSASEKPVRVSSPEYVDYVMTWVEDQIDNPEIFPAMEEEDFPDNFATEIVPNIMSKMFRVFAIIYNCHFKAIETLDAVAHLNTVFKHFMFFNLEFGLIHEREFRALTSPVRKLTQEFKEKKAEASYGCIVPGRVFVEALEPSTTSEPTKFQEEAAKIDKEDTELLLQQRREAARNGKIITVEDPVRIRVNRFRGLIQVDKIFETVCMRLCQDHLTSEVGFAIQDVLNSTLDNFHAAARVFEDYMLHIRHLDDSDEVVAKVFGGVEQWHLFTKFIATRVHEELAKHVPPETSAAITTIAENSTLPDVCEITLEHVLSEILIVYEENIKYLPVVYTSPIASCADAMRFLEDARVLEPIPKYLKFIERQDKRVQNCDKLEQLLLGPVLQLSEMCNQFEYLSKVYEDYLQKNFTELEPAQLEVLFRLQALEKYVKQQQENITEKAQQIQERQQLVELIHRTGANLAVDKDCFFLCSEFATVGYKNDNKESVVKNGTMFVFNKYLLFVFEGEENATPTHRSRQRNSTFGGMFRSILQKIFTRPGTQETKSHLLFKQELCRITKAQRVVAKSKDGNYSMTFTQSGKKYTLQTSSELMVHDVFSTLTAGKKEPLFKELIRINTMHSIAEKQPRYGRGSRVATIGSRGEQVMRQSGGDMLRRDSDNPLFGDDISEGGSSTSSDEIQEQYNEPLSVESDHYDFFISYAQGVADDAVDLLYLKLTMEYGFKVFLDKYTMKKTLTRSQMKTGIQNSDVFLLFLNKETLNHKAVVFEVQTALERYQKSEMELVVLFEPAGVEAVPLDSHDPHKININELLGIEAVPGLKEIVFSQFHRQPDHQETMMKLVLEQCGKVVR